MWEFNIVKVVQLWWKGNLLDLVLWTYNNWFFQSRAVIFYQWGCSTNPVGIQGLWKCSQPEKISIIILIMMWIFNLSYISRPPVLWHCLKTGWVCCRSFRLPETYFNRSRYYSQFTQGSFWRNAAKMEGVLFWEIVQKQARKLQATLEGCNPKLWITHWLTDGGKV